MQIQSWIKIGEEKYQCKFCKQIIVSSSPKIDHLCKAQPRPITGPSLSRRAFNFFKALAKHAGDGFKRRTKEQIEEILDTHCKRCKYFNGVICTHEKCGCNVNAEQKFFNKLSFASEKCPIDKW